MIRICRAADIPEGGGRGYVIDRAGAVGGDAMNIMVVRADGMLRAYVNACPHLGINLDWRPDQFLDYDRSHIQCSTHGALFRIADGLCVAGPCRGKSLEAVPIVVEGDEILLAQDV